MYSGTICRWVIQINLCAASMRVVIKRQYDVLFSLRITTGLVVWHSYTTKKFEFNSRASLYQRNLWV